MRALRIFSFFNAAATTDIYTLSLHDALPISLEESAFGLWLLNDSDVHIAATGAMRNPTLPGRSEEHTSELQSRFDVVCRLLLEKKKEEEEEIGSFGLTAPNAGHDGASPKPNE